MNYDNDVNIFKDMDNKIDKELDIYRKCDEMSYDLLCGRIRINYSIPSVPIVEHKSFVSYTIISLCNKYNIIACTNADILIGILSRPNLIYERMIIRRIIFNKRMAKFLFITGKSKNRSINILLEKEKKKFNDIITFNIISSYYNCSAIMACFYMYLYKVCTNIKWILKLDIDTYVNINLLLYIIRNVNESISVIGSINKKAKLKCNIYSKWSIECNNETKISMNSPPYPYGPAFAFKASSLKCINLFFNNKERIIWIEDVFFGIIMKYCQLKYKDITQLADISYNEKFNLTKYKNMVVIHGFYPIEILFINEFIKM